MKRSLFALLALCFADAALADSQTGTIQICRRAGIVSLSDSRPVTIHKGARFVQDVRVKGHDPLNGLVIKTREDVTLGAKPACARVHAVVSEHSPVVQSITAKTVFLQQFDDGVDLTTRAVEGFH